VSVVVVGAGVAGLAAASALAERGCAVTVLEAAPALGGRARSFLERSTGDIVDNGQHALMGCYHEFLGLLTRIGRRGSLWESELDVPLWDAARGVRRLACPALPSPLHFAAGVMRFGHLSFRQRLSALRAGRALVARFGRGEGRDEASTVAEALRALRQSPQALRALWDPLTWAALNADPNEASAALLAAVVSRALLGPRAASRFLLPALPLSELYAEPARKFIEGHGGTVHCRAPVDEVVVEGGRAVGVRSRGEFLRASRVVLAVPPPAVRRIASPHLCSVVPAALERATPIVSVTLWLDRPVGGPDFLGLLDSQMQWLFQVDRIQRPEAPGRRGPEGARLVCVRSGASGWLQLPTREIAGIALREAARALPGAAQAELRHALVVKEVAATLAPSPALQSLRPGVTVPVRDLLLAGDWTDTGLPATLESAALSGHRAAAVAFATERAAA
jgi:squalene-associated FAD-dependent desaturase